MNAATRKALAKRLDALDGGTKRLAPLVALYLPANGRDVLLEAARNVVRIFDPAREKAARRAGLGEREALEAARMTDDEIEAVNEIGDHPEITVDPTAGVSGGEATP